LQAINDAFGREAADSILHEFSSMMAEEGGGTFDAAHPHGDEYLAHHADGKQLQAFFSDLKTTADRTVFFSEKKSGLVIQVGLNFVHGIGRTLDEADRIDLARNKAAQGDVKPPNSSEPRKEDGKSSNYEIKAIPLSGLKDELRRQFQRARAEREAREKQPGQQQ
jgi:hypothetical protein